MLALLWIELVALFVLLPVTVYYFIYQLSDWLMPILGLVSLLCLGILLADKHFKRFRLWHWQDISHHLLTSMRFFVPLAFLLSLAVYWTAPDLFLSWPVQQPELWLATLLLYPLVSVIPQEIIYRTYFFHRYKPILPSKSARWMCSTFAFGLAHVVYGNWIAVLISWCGGALFGYRYLQTRSTPVVVFEHALWGSLLFTVGLGSFLMIQP